MRWNCSFLNSKAHKIRDSKFWGCEIGQKLKVAQSSIQYFNEVVLSSCSTDQYQIYTLYVYQCITRGNLSSISLFVTMQFVSGRLKAALCLLGAGAFCVGVAAAWRWWANRRRRRVGIVRGRQLIGSLPFANGTHVTFASPFTESDGSLSPASFLCLHRTIHDDQDDRTRQKTNTCFFVITF